MTAFKRGRGGNRSIYVPTRAGGLVQRSTGTPVASVVRGMERMVAELKDTHRWVILDALTIPVPPTPPSKRATFRLALSRCYQFYASNQLDALEAELSAKNLADALNDWKAWAIAERRDNVETVDVYWQQVTTLIVPGVPFPASSLTKDRVKTWLASREKASSGTRRKYFYALKSFINYCLDAKFLDRDPLVSEGRKMKAPRKNPARERWETAAVDEKIVKAALPKYRAFFAFIKSTGADVSSARRALIADVNVFGTTPIRGTKTDNRFVPNGVIESWALPYLRAHIKARKAANDGPLMFPGIPRKAPAQHHARVCAKLGIHDYTLKDARHSVGVRMRLAKKEFEEIAAQLGTSVYHAVTVYTRYRPEDVQPKEEAK